VFQKLSILPHRREGKFLGIGVVTKAKPLENVYQALLYFAKM